ncbi:hypothetical protein D3C72_929610 [compost metagenome]
MSHFRLVILDYVKEQLENPVAQKILSDVLFVKQKNFLRTDPNYVVMDKHDMIGTHYLIYDTTDFLSPKLVFAIRTTFLGRANAHRIETPLMSLVPKLETRLQNAFKDFHKGHPELVDCNAWFVDSAFSKKNSGLALSDIGYFMVCMNAMRNGFNNIVGCTNETYGASRWVEKVGVMEKGLLFEHPSVKAPHMMLLVDQFNLPHFAKVYAENKVIIDELFEVMPTTGTQLPSITEFAASILGELSMKRRGDSSAA